MLAATRLPVSSVLPLSRRRRRRRRRRGEEAERSSRAFAFVGLASVRRAKHTHVEKPSPGNEDAAWAVGAVSLVHVESQ